VIVDSDCASSQWEHLAKIERELCNNGSDVAYKKRLQALGIKPKAQLELTIPDEAQQVAFETLFSQLAMLSISSISAKMRHDRLVSFKGCIRFYEALAT